MKSNKEIITEIFAAAAQSKGRPFAEAMADDCVWRAIGTLSWSGEYRGKETILRDLLGPLGQRIEGGRTTTIPSRIHDAGDFVIVEANGRNRTTGGKDYNNQYCFVIRLRDGKMVEITEYLDTKLVETALGDRA